jgi:enoyl-[acyl-carrier-protein] reductase (NADH)
MTKVVYKDPERNRLILDHIPLKRWGNPMEGLNGMVVYLSSEASNCNTGHVMYVDGGELVY